MQSAHALGKARRGVVTAIAAITAAASATACGSDTGTTPLAKSISGSTLSGGVVSVVVSPKTLNLPRGYYGHVVAAALDAQNVIVAGKTPTWRSSDPTIAVVSDTGVVYANAQGTAKIYGTIDGVIDSATVVVTAPVTPTSPPSPTPSDSVPRTPPPPTPPASSFNLAVSVVAAVGTDTTVTQPAGGVKVQAFRLSDTQGTALPSPTLVGTATTDAAGKASLSGLPGGTYRITAVPPAGSPYPPQSVQIGAPTRTDVSIYMLLLRGP
ncbi:MAG: prealbumin-like fold domain-containing protein [bacterium]